MVADEDAPESQPDSVRQLNSTFAPSINEFHSFDKNSGCHPHKFSKEPKKNAEHMD